MIVGQLDGEIGPFRQRNHHRAGDTLVVLDEERHRLGPETLIFRESVFLLESPATNGGQVWNAEIDEIVEFLPGCPIGFAKLCIHIQSPDGIDILLSFERIDRIPKARLVHGRGTDTPTFEEHEIEGPPHPPRANRLVEPLR